MNRRVLKEREKILGVEYPNTLASVNNLASVIRDQGKHEAAEEMNRRTLKGVEKVLAAEYLGTLTGVHNLVLVFRN